MSKLCCALTSLALFVALPVFAQVGGGPVQQEGGPVSGLSTNVQTGSGSVREGNGNPYDADANRRLSGNPVRGSITGDLLSGSVSDLSAGAVTSSRPVAGSGTVGQSSAGAVTKDITSPLGAMIAEPVQEFGALQERLRAVQPLPRDMPLSDESAAEQEVAAQAADDVASVALAQEQQQVDAGAADVAESNSLEAAQPAAAQEAPADDPASDEPAEQAGSDPEAGAADPEAPTDEAHDDQGAPPAPDAEP